MKLPRNSAWMVLFLGLVMVASVVYFRGRNRPQRQHPASQSRPTLVLAMEAGAGAAPDVSTSIPESSSPDISDDSSVTAAAVEEGRFDRPDSWSRFRGANGQGISLETSVPFHWSERENLKWKCDLPGAGASSPILTENFVFVTSYSGYGTASSKSGKIENLSRQLSCIDRRSGKILWTESVPAVLPEDPYQGMGLPEHGYATNSPVTDGYRVYVFFGKSGVMAYDLDGKQVWKVLVGSDSGNRGWGTAASLVLYNQTLIVNASEESQAIVGLDCKTGKKRWEASASLLELAYGTPVVKKIDDHRTDLILAVPNEVWGLDPLTGKLRWFVETSLTGNVSPSVVLDDSRMYIFGGYRSSGSLSIRFGGLNDSTNSHVEWTSRNSSYVATPVLYQGRLYWIDDRGLAYCVEAASGEVVYRERVTELESGGRPVYASPIVIGDKIYIQTRESGVIVLAGTTKYDAIAQNRIASDKSIFNATPAVSQGQLFLRSDQALYCISHEIAGE